MIPDGPPRPASLPASDNGAVILGGFSSGFRRHLLARTAVDDGDGVRFAAPRQRRAAVRIKNDGFGQAGRKVCLILCFFFVVRGGSMEWRTRR